jgi:hypothetical protein
MRAAKIWRERKATVVLTAVVRTVLMTVRERLGGDGKISNQ